VFWRILSELVETALITALYSSVVFILLQTDFSLLPNQQTATLEWTENLSSTLHALPTLLTTTIARTPSRNKVDTSTPVHLVATPLNSSNT